MDSEKRKWTRLQGKIMGTQDGEHGRTRRSFPNTAAQEGYDEGYEDGHIHAMRRRGHAFPAPRKNPSDNWFYDLVLLPFVVIGGVWAIYSMVTSRPSALASVDPNATPATTNLTAADHAVIKGVQDRLRWLGYDPGPSTGDWNHQTNYALAFFQRDVMHIATPTGILNGATAVALENASNARVQALRDTLAAQSETMFWSTLLPLFR